MTTATKPPPDLDAIEREITGRVDELRAERQALALDALSNKRAKVKLEDVESRLGSAQAELGRVELARVEVERRDAAARQAELDERQRAALADARRLQTRREQAAKAIDQAAAEHVAAVVEYVDVCRDQQRKLREAGRPEAAHTARPSGFAVEAAFALALREATWGHHRLGVWERLPLIPVMHQKPLAERDARPVDSAEE